MKTPTPPPSGNTAKPDRRDPVTLGRLHDYMKRHNLTNDGSGRKKLAKQISTNPTYIYRYLTNEFLGRLDHFEELLLSFLDHEVDRITGNRDLIESDFIVDPVWGFLRHVQSHGHIGVGYGHAGRGKTCACRLYAMKNKTVIYHHVNIWSNDRHSIVAALAQKVGLKVGRSLVDEALVERLSGSGRLIILDNFHKATKTSRSWVADFWDATRAPIALVGNPAIVEQFQSNDQHGSRLGLCRDITTALDTGSTATAKHLFQLHLPDEVISSAMLQEAAGVISSFGSCRALTMRLVLTREMLRGKKVTDPAQAFALAKTQLLTA